MQFVSEGVSGPVVAESITAVLEERAQRQPDDIAYTFIDYDVDPAGFAETLTWAQLFNRVQVVASELRKLGKVGDRAAILAPQSLDYIVGFLGALEAGFVAVPLSVPMLGVHDERATAVLKDCTPTVVLTTSAAVDAVMPSLAAVPGATILEVDALDLDSPAPPHGPRELPKTAFLQYTSGSTRTPAGVMVTHESLMENMRQIQADWFEDTDGIAPPNTTLVSWLPFYHDMGLVLGIFGTIAYDGMNAVLTTPMAFLQKPARWMQLVARNTNSVSPAPNFAYELAVRRTSDEDMAGLDLAHVHSLVSGAERIHAATIRRFNERFAKFNLPDTAFRSAYGLAEATVYVTSGLAARQIPIVRFDYEKLAASYAKRCEDVGVELIGHGKPRSCTFRIVDPETCIENPSDRVGEIWVHGDNVSAGYWRNPQASERTFGGQLVNPSPGTPEGPWLRTGDLGVISDDELFIIGRIKDLLIVDGRNHYPDDIEATIQEISGGRVAAISVADDHSEQLVAIVEFKNRGSAEEASDRIQSVKRELTSAISRSHGVRVSDLVMVPPGSIPITTSGKIRRSSCIELYRRHEFARLDGTV